MDSAYFKDFQEHHTYQDHKIKHFILKDHYKKV